MPTHMGWFNYKRHNSYKSGSPLKLLKESKQNFYPPEIFDLPVILLDSYIEKTPGYNLTVKYICLRKLTLKLRST